LHTSASGARFTLTRTVTSDRDHAQNGRVIYRRPMRRMANEARQGEQVVIMQPVDPVSFTAFARLLARQDPPDLPRRGHVVRCEGAPNRRATHLPGILMASLTRRRLELDVEEPLVAATRTQATRECAVDSDQRADRS
jgi:hypothetical protein